MPDQLGSPFTMIIDPEGRVSYEFDGHIHARGLDLDAGTTDSPPADRKLRWLREADGAVVVELSAFIQDELDIDALGISLFNPDTGQVGGQLTIHNDKGAGPSYVRARAGAGVPVLITDTDERSQFLQLPTAEKLKLQRGYALTAFPAPDGNGNSAASINFTAWPNNHFLFLAHVWPYTSWNFFSKTSGPTGLGQGTIVLNSPAQNFDVNWLSIGN